MTLLHPALLMGLALVAIPVALHLMLRARPKKLMFPALRLLQQRKLQNQRRMRLRHLWLLLLRMGLIAALVLAVARPSLPAANYQLTLWEILRLAGILALGAAAYFVTMLLWRRQRQPPPVLRNRRTYLRGGVGLATLLLALLLVAWPYQRRIAAELTSPRPHVVENLPVAAVFVCDTSLSMTYQFEGRSRLQAGQQIAANHLQQLPPGSQTAVMELSGDLPVVLTPDLAAVRNRLEALTTQPVTNALNDQLRAAIRVQRDERTRVLGEQASIPEASRQDQFVREIYLFTDLAKSAWRSDDSGTLQAELKELDWLGVYLIDVGVDQPSDLGIVDARLSRQSTGAGGSATVSATVRRSGSTTREAMVELWLGQDETSLAKRDQQAVLLSDSPTATVMFPLDTIAGPILQGQLKLVTSDPLAMDDAAAFTVAVQPPLNVLVVAPDRSTAAFWLEALEALSELGSTFRPRFITSEQLIDVDLADVDVVCLLNVQQPAETEWRRLKEFVEAGGGVFVSLGASSSLAAGSRRTIDPLAYSQAAAQELLPVRPKAALQFSPPEQLDFQENSLPLRQRLEAIGALTELADVDFRRYWSVDVNDGALVLACWTGEQAPPALVLRDLGQGRCVAFLSSVDSTAWSDWPRNWTFVVVADQILQLLSRQATSRHNYLSGDPASLPVDADDLTGQLLLRQPDLTQRRLEVEPGSRTITISDAPGMGNYQVVNAGPPPRLVTGFSVNLLPAESDLTRMTPDDLNALLGKDRYAVARDPEQLTKSVLAGRFGQEISGSLLMLLVLVFIGEQATATWFYRQDDARESQSTA